MAKEKDPFGGFDLFNPVQRLKTPDPAEATETEVKVEAVQTQEELDRKASIEQELNIPEKVETPKKVEKQAESSKSKDIVNTDPETNKTSSEKTIEDNTNEDETPAEEQEKYSFKPLVEYLNEKGIVSIEQEELENFEDSEEGLEQIVGNTIKKEVTRGIEDYKSQYPDDVQEFLKFIELGGSPKDFYDVYYGNVSFEKMNPDTEENQKFIIREGLKLSGLEDKDIEEELKDYEDLGKLEAKAGFYLKRLQSYEKSQKENLIKIQENQEKERQNSITKYWNDLKESLNSKESVQGFKLTPKLKEQLWDYIASPDKKTGKTKLQIHNETNKDAQFLYAYLAMNNWDLSKLEKQITTKVSSDLKQKLGRFTDNRNKIASGRTYREEQSTEDHFEGFNKLKI